MSVSGAHYRETPVIRELPGTLCSPAAQASRPGTRHPCCLRALARTSRRPKARRSRAPAACSHEPAPTRPTALQTKVRIIIITSNATRTTADTCTRTPGRNLSCQTAGGDACRCPAPSWRGPPWPARPCWRPAAPPHSRRTSPARRQDHRGRRGERVRGRHRAGRREVRAGQRHHEQPQHGPAHVRGERVDRPPGQRGPARGAERPGLRHVHGHDREGGPRLRPPHRSWCRSCSACRTARRTPTCGTTPPRCPRSPTRSPRTSPRSSPATPPTSRPTQRPSRTRSAPGSTRSGHSSSSTPARPWPPPNPSPTTC